jgi:Peptidase_C39 like family
MSPRLFTLFLTVLLLFCLFAFGLWVLPHRIEGVGGIPVPGRLLITIPRFAQADPLWAGNLLAGTPGTLGDEGCAVASVSMVLAHAGADADPARLNRFLLEHEGYEGRGWLRWETAGLFPGANLEKAYEDLPSYELIDVNLLRGNPVIVRVRRLDGITHFVVIVGKQGFDYLIRDPAGSPGGGEVYPLSRLGVPVEALRFYRSTR